MLGRFTTRRIAAPALTGPEPESAPTTVTLEPPEPVTETPAATLNALLSEKLLDAKVRLHRRLIEEINLPALEKMPQEEVRRQVPTGFTHFSQSLQ
jgi:pilus assembly protein CpaF